ncbi:MAG: glycoside hydrolase family 1 protein [Patescibacteria group bacterium]|nr:glycoside hydrolase family 1 protein [Patescibacteria group bacterium]MDE2437874.1 glycoside hydrolase family 1 protein [Patescibacteria group bacterium]
MKQFPPQFLWGASTSAHQVEGNNHNDWSEWELRTATQKAYRASLHTFPEYITKRYPDPRSKENYISGIAADHYHRFKEDIDLLQSLNLNAYRFSIEWSRIEPQEGEWNEEALLHYEEVLRELAAQKIEPFVTLWHWPLPIWLRDKGGWECSKTPEYFSRYAAYIATRLGSHIRFWITLNEPEVYASKSYLLGVWPPQKRNYFAYAHVMKNLVRGHRAAYHCIKAVDPHAQIGIAKQNAYFEAHKKTLVNRLLCALVRWYGNEKLLNSIDTTQDFIGLNHYFHYCIHQGAICNNKAKKSDLGWELYPEGIYHVLKDLELYRKPIYITENGLADAEDMYRAWFIKETLYHIHRAIQEKVDVRGYFHWSLLDNFEWAEGFWPRFGLVEIDYHTLTRIPRPSCIIYATIAHNNALD